MASVFLTLRGLADTKLTKGLDVLRKCPQQALNGCGRGGLDAVERHAYAGTALNAVAMPRRHESDAALVMFGDLLDNGQAQSAAVLMAAQHTEKPVEDAIAILR